MSSILYNLTYLLLQVDEELLKKSIGDSDSDLGIGSSASSTMSGGASRKTWTTTRRSFFKRKKGGRSSSRDSSAAKELASFSDMASLNYSDSGALHEVEPQINSYVRVERLDCKYIKHVEIVTFYYIDFFYFYRYGN